MRTKHLLTGLVLPALFAACTAEEIVEQQAVIKNDLGARPVVGNVTLSTSSADSRATLNEDGDFNSLKFAEGDVIGARIMDIYSPYAGTSCDEDEDCAVCENPYWNYDIKNEFASSNYKYTNGGDGNWNTDALMVEGNYMFYFPYNEKFLERGPVKVTLPLKQTVSATAPKQAIQDLYEGENPFIVAYNFLPAVGQESTLGLDFQHVFAYPYITLKNSYKEENEETGKKVAKAITLDKIIISTKEEATTKIQAEGVINHENLAAALNNVLIDECENHDAVEAGTWVTLNDDARVKAGTFKKYIQTATSDDIVDFSGDASYITVDIEDVTLQPGETFSFYTVMPALKFAEGDITIRVYLANNKMFDKAFEFGTINEYITFVPGKRYPMEEYNYTGAKASAKTTAGKLSTFDLSGDLTEAVLPIKPISNITEFEAMLDEIADNTLTLKEGTVDQVNDGDADFALAKNKDGKTLLEINDEVMALLDEYLANGEIEFTSDMVVKATALDNIHFANVTFASENVTVNANVKATTATIESGKVTVSDKADAAEESLGTVTVKAGELAVAEAGYLANTNVIVSETLDEDEEVIATGTLTIGATNSLDKVTMNNGDVVVNANVTKSAGTFTKGTITNNKTITLSADWTVADDVVLKNKGSIAGQYDLNNEGTIETEKNLEVEENNGLIIVKNVAASIVIEEGEGEVDNTIAGMVTLNNSTGATPNNKNVVYAELSAITSVKEDINAVYDAASAVSKIVATGTWTVRTGGDDEILNNSQFKAVEFKGATLTVASVTLNLGSADVIINANTTWTGRGDESKVVFSGDLVYKMYDSDDADTDVDTYYTLTCNKVAISTTVAAVPSINPSLVALKQASENGGIVTLVEDVALTENFTLTKSLTLNLNGNKVTYTGVDKIPYRVNNGATLTISGGEFISGGYIASANAGGTINVTSGTYTSTDNTCFQANGGAINISGGTFEAEPWSNGVYYTINYIDDKKYTNSIKISGGTFKNFNPAASASEDPVMSFLASNATVKVYKGSLTNEVTNVKPTSSNSDTSKTYAEQPCRGTWNLEYYYVVE